MAEATETASRATGLSRFIIKTARRVDQELICAEVKMKRPFRFKKVATALASTGTLAALIGGTALAWGSASVSVTPCDPSASTCVEVFQPVIRTFEKATGPSFTDLAGGVVHPVIRMDNVPNGFYKVEANGILDVPAIDAITTEPDTALGDFDWKCTLYMVTADNGSGAAVDSWETEADSLTDTTFFLKAGVNLNSSSGEGSFRVDCSEQ